MFEYLCKTKKIFSDWMNIKSIKILITELLKIIVETELFSLEDYINLPNTSNKDIHNLATCIADMFE